MSTTTGIEWTDATWSPIRARVRDDAGAIARAKGYKSLIQIADKMAGNKGPHCESVSEECDRCYSETNNGRCLPANGTGLPFDRRSRDLVEVFLDEKILMEPLRWKRGRRIFVENQSDLFGEWVPDEMIDRVFAVAALSSQHTFQVLTKRSQEMREYFHDVGYRAEMIGIDAELRSGLDRFVRSTDELTGTADDILPRWPFPLPNVWLGVSVGARKHLHRIDDLRNTPAAVRFLSLEPLLEDLGTLDLTGIHWVIVGGESGDNTARMMQSRWVRSIRNQCIAAKVAFFFKQWGSFLPDTENPEMDEDSRGGAPPWAGIHMSKKKAGRLLDGRTWDEMPEGR